MKCLLSFQKGKPRRKYDESYNLAPEIEKNSKLNIVQKGHWLCDYDVIEMSKYIFLTPQNI